MPSDAQAKIVMVLLLSFVMAVLWGFIRALVTGKVGVSLVAGSALGEVVRRDEQPGRYWRAIAFWAFALLVGFGLFSVPLVVM